MSDKWFEKVKEHSAFVRERVGADQMFATMLYGSQNYGLATENSDADTKVMVLPTPETIIFHKKLMSTEMHLPDESLANVKDFRLMLENFKKSNINFLECLFTDYVLVNLNYAAFWDDLHDHRHLIANSRPMSLLGACAGMARQKYEHFNKHFAGKEEVLAKYGYDPKQLMHQVRLAFFMGTYIECANFEVCLKPGEVELEYLMNLKLDPPSYEAALKLREDALHHVDKLMELARKRFNDFDKEFAVACDEYMQKFTERLMMFYMKRTFGGLL